MGVHTAKSVAYFMRNHHRVPHNARVAGRKPAVHIRTHTIGVVFAVLAQTVDIGNATASAARTQQMHMVTRLRKPAGIIPVRLKLIEQHIG